MNEPTMSVFPTFSVILPTYNRAHLLGRTIRSVLAQTYQDYELIIVDDGSTDNTPEVVQSYDDSRIRYVYQHNAGAALARNLGVKNANGQYLIFLDSDDEVLPEWLTHFAGVFEQSQVGIVCGGVIKVDASNEETLILPTNDGAIYCNQTVLFLAGAFALRRELFEAVGGYADRASRQQMDLARRIIPYSLQRGWTIESFQTPVIRYFWHKSGRISTDILAQYQGAKATLNDDGDMLIVRSPQTYAMYCGVAGTNAFKLGKHSEARYFFWKALRHYPRHWKYYARFLLSLFPPLARIVWRNKRNS